MPYAHALCSQDGRDALCAMLLSRMTRSAAPSPVFEDGVKERGSGLTLSKPRPLGRGVEGLT